MDKINENIEKITENEEKIEMNQHVNVVEDKIETKGLKLKKSTKDRLNMLQSNFDDAESMIVTLLNQYDNFKIESSEKFSDRKGEIDRFNFLIDSLKGCFVNSLEMATYLEDKYAVKLKNEMKKKDKIISILQEENTELKKKNKETDEGIRHGNKPQNDFTAHHRQKDTGVFRGRRAQGAACHRGKAGRQNDPDPPAGTGSLPEFCGTEFFGKHSRAAAV